MKKLTVTLMACAIIFSTMAQKGSPFFERQIDRNQSAEKMLIAKAKKLVDSKFETNNYQRNFIDDETEKLDSMVAVYEDTARAAGIFEYNALGLNTMLKMVYLEDDGSRIEGERYEYEYSDNGLETNRKEYEHRDGEMVKETDIDYFYNEADRLDSMSMLKIVGADLMQLEANLMYNEAEQVSSTIFYSDILDDGILQKVYQIDYYYSNALLDSIYERNLEGDLDLFHENTKSFTYNESKLIEQVHTDGFGYALRDNYMYSDEGLLEEVITTYFTSDHSMLSSKDKFTYASTDEVISPILLKEMDVNWLDFGKLSETKDYRYHDENWIANGVLDFYYSTLGSGTGINTNETDADYFAMYPNPTNGELTINLSGEGNHEVQVFSMSGQLVASELVSTQQTIDLSAIESGYYFVQVSQNGVTLGAKKLIKQ